MKLSLAYFNHPVLRRKADRVNHIDDNLRELVEGMIKMMHALDGIGIAAPQDVRESGPDNQHAAGTQFRRTF